MTGVAWLLEGAIVILLGTILLSRWPRLQGAWWVITGGFFLWALATWPGDRLILFLGRPLYMEQPLTWGYLSLALDGPAREGVRMILWAFVLWGGISLLFPSWGEGGAWASLALIGGLLALMVTSLWAVGWAVAIWAALVVLVTLGGHSARGLGVWQWLTPWVGATLILFLLLIWPDPNTSGPEAWRVQLVAVALVLWAGLVPLHVGSVNLTAFARPLGSAWLWWSHSIVVLTVFHRVDFLPGMDAAFWRAQPFLQVMGIVTLGWAGMAALGTRDVGRITAYAVLHNWALTLLLWIATPQREDVVRWALAVRFVGVYVTTLGLTALLREEYRRTFDSLSGWARRRPWTVAAWTIGVGTLVGAPFTPGIWTQWMVHRLPMESPLVPWGSFVGSAGVMLGVSRALLVLWGPLHNPLLVREEGLARALMWGIVITVVVLALMPSWANSLGGLL